MEPKKHKVTVKVYLYYWSNITDICWFKHACLVNLQVKFARCVYAVNANHPYIEYTNIHDTDACLGWIPELGSFKPEIHDVMTDEDR